MCHSHEILGNNIFGEKMTSIAIALEVWAVLWVSLPAKIAEYWGLGPSNEKNFHVIFKYENHLLKTLLFY